MVSANFILILILIFLIFLILLSRLYKALRDLRACERTLDMAVKSNLELMSDKYPQDELESNEDYRARIREKLVINAERLSL